MVPIIDGFVPVGGEVHRLIGFDPLAGGGIGSTARLDLRGGSAPELGGFLTGDAVIADASTAQAVRAAQGAISAIPVTVIETAETGALLADLPTAQRLLGREGELDAIWLRTAASRGGTLAWLDRLLPGIAAAATEDAGPTIDGFLVTPMSRWNPLARFADSIAFNLGALSMLSLADGGLPRRRGELLQRRAAAARARAAAGRRRLPPPAARLACGEGLLIGAGSTMLGLGLGLGVCRDAAAGGGRDGSVGGRPG